MTVRRGLSGTLPEDWRECPTCGLVSRLPEVAPHLTAHCPRCGQSLWHRRGCSFELPLACAVAGALFFSYAVIAPFLEISSHGQFQLARIETGPSQLSLQGYSIVGLLVFGVTVVMPGTQLAIILTTLLGLETHLLPRAFLRDIFRWYERIRPWAMVDVYLLGFLVAYTRLAVIATVHLDTALFALVGLMLSVAAANFFLDAEAVWRRLDATRLRRPCATHRHAGAGPIGCQTCGLVNLALSGDCCLRCEAVLDRRRPASIARCWAYVIAATIFYIPANLYPVMTIASLVRSQQYTIMGGIFELFEHGLWPLGLLVFFASITIPILKLLALSYMLVNTQLGSREHLQGRSLTFRVIGFIGRWSMIDVFMISILVALVRFGKFSAVHAEFGATCFAAVVVLTMIAAAVFDPRLMWDRAAGARGARQASARDRSGQPAGAALGGA